MKKRVWDRSIKANSDFGYATGRIRVREGQLLSRDALLRLASAGTEQAEWNQILNQASYPPAASIRERLHAMLESNDAFLLEVADQTALPRVLLLEYDYHHLKVMLKTWLLSLRQVADEQAEQANLQALLLSQQTLFRAHAPTEPERLARWLAARLAKLEPSVSIAEDLATRVNQVLEELPTDAEVAAVDRRLDRAYYGHLEALARTDEAKPFRDLLLDYLAIQADSANLQSFYRLRKVRAQPQDLKREWVPGGQLKLASLEANFHATEQAIAELLRSSGSLIAGLARDLGYQRSEDWTQFSRERDNLLLRLASGSSQTPYGPEIPFGFWLGRVMEVRNLRIILAGLERGLESDEIAQYLRDDYRRRY